MKAFVIITFILTFPLALWAQTPNYQDCLGAIPICNLVYEQKDPSKFKGTGNYKHEILRIGDECLIDENNGIWYVFNAQTTGILRFKITPENEEDDFDWDLFDLTKGSCSDLAVKPHEYLVSANCWGNMKSTINGTTGISSKISGGKAGNCNGPGDINGPSWNDDVTVIEGHTYLLYVTFVLGLSGNSTGNEKGFKIDFSESEASLFNSMQTKLDYLKHSQTLAGDTLITFDFNKRVSCESVSKEDFELSNNGEKLNIKKISSQECLVGSLYAKSFEVISQTPFEPGSAQLKLSGQVDDACRNKSLTNSLNLDISGITITKENSDNIKCTTAASGSITVVAESADNDLYYSIDGGKTFSNKTGVFKQLEAGEYQIMVKNRYDYIVKGSLIKLNKPSNIAMSITQIKPVSPCFGDKNGSFFLQYSELNSACKISLDGGQNYKDAAPNTSITGLDAGTYTVMLKDQQACESQSITVEISQPDPILFESEYTSVKCKSEANGRISFTNTSKYPSLQYSINGGSTFSSASEYTNLNAGTYSLQAKAPSGCILSGQTVVLTEPEPMKIEQFVQTNIRYDNLSSGGSIAIRVTGGRGTMTYRLNGTESNTTGEFTGIPEGPYYIIASDSLGCSMQTQTYIMHIRAHIETVNTFTPNGDGKNDYWIIKNIEEYPNAVVSFFDRWNHLLFQAERGYHQPWDGSINGRPLPMDTYYYIIDVGEGYPIEKGYITLVR